MKALKKGLLYFNAVLLSIGLVACGQTGAEVKPNTDSASQQAQNAEDNNYQISEEEKQYLKERFEPLLETNKETVGYIYIPNTQLDEPIVQTSDNATYLDKTFEGNNEPFLGTVFLDADNHKNFSDKLTWLFGHARGSKVSDHRMFNDVNFYDKEDFMLQHKYVVVETPARKFYYEFAFAIIVPETTAFYRTDFTDDHDFFTQIQSLRKEAQVINDEVKPNEKDKYLVLSTCREEDETIRMNVYLRQIPNSEIKTFLEQHEAELAYVPQR